MLFGFFVVGAIDWLWPRSCCCCSVTACVTRGLPAGIAHVEHDDHRARLVVDDDHDTAVAARSSTLERNLSPPDTEVPGRENPHRSGWGSRRGCEVWMSQGPNAKSHRGIVPLPAGLEGRKPNNRTTLAPADGRSHLATGRLGPPTDTRPPHVPLGKEPWSSTS